ncbi:MAG TPA: hypothetical protein DCF99_14415, partial [Flavobacteriaceae bacterium]|nr:hypothetical protein [Flavobacteriaceae bacterium]
NEKKNYKEASSYQFYKNINYLADFDKLKNELNKKPADFNAQILFYQLKEAYSIHPDADKTVKQLNEVIQLYPKSIWTNNLVEFRNDISAPNLDIQ